MNRLRFELGGEIFDNVDSPVPRALQAIERSRALFDATFGTSAALTAVVASHPAAVAGPNDISDSFSALTSLGFRCPAVAEWLSNDDGFDDEDSAPVLWRSFDVTSDMAAQLTLIWSSITAEMAITPKAPATVFFIDIDRAILFHIYDDRGLDITALDPDQLTPLFNNFNIWLLEYDRPRMDAIFAET